MNNKFNFSSKFKLANIFSLIFFMTSVIFILFKGLNYGIDFKGGTLIELRSNNTNASEIRSLLNNMDLGDVNVKKFGKDGDYLIKVEQKVNNTNKKISQIKKAQIARHQSAHNLGLIINSRNRHKQGRTNHRNAGKTSVDRSTKTTLILTIRGCN